MLKDDCIFKKKKEFYALFSLFLSQTLSLKTKQRSIIDPYEETIMKLRALIINFKPLSNTLLQLFCVFTMIYIIQVIMKF